MTLDNNHTHNTMENKYLIMEHLVEDFIDNFFTKKKKKQGSKLKTYNSIKKHFQ